MTQGPIAWRFAAVGRKPRVGRGLSGLTWAVMAMAALPATVSAQQTPAPPPGEPTTSVATRQDLPRVRIDDADGASHGRADTEPAGRRESSAYTFLSSTPGSYARATRITGRLSYVEHLEKGPRYVSFRGGLRVALGK